jgi:hypothetical protein
VERADGGGVLYQSSTDVSMFTKVSVASSSLAVISQQPGLGKEMELGKNP